MINRIEEINRRLSRALHPCEVSVLDQSAAHKNHLSAQQSGGGHFVVSVVSTKFEGLSTINRHRLIYTVLEDLIGPEIHALQIVTKTPTEQEKQG